MGELAIRVPVGTLEWTDEQRQIVRDTFANGASDAEFAVLIETAKLWNLNPFKRQIYFVQRWDSQKRRMVWSVQVAIDGLRAMAERTGLYAGQDEPEYVHDAKGKLESCKVRVYRKDWQRPMVGVAHFSEYAQKTKEGEFTSFWREKPHVMIAKCAEAIALRKAFPEQLAGAYAPEEMGNESIVDLPRSSATIEAAPLRAIDPHHAAFEADEDALLPVRDAITNCDDAPTVEQAACIWLENKASLTDPANAQGAWKLLQKACGSSSAALKRACEAIEAKSKAPVAVVETPAPVETVVDAYSAVQAIADYTRAQSLDEVTAIDAEVAKLGLAKNSSERAAVIVARNAATARLGGPRDDGPKGKRQVRSEQTTAANDGAESVTQDREQAIAEWRDEVQSIGHVQHARRKWNKHTDRPYRAERLRELVIAMVSNGVANCERDALSLLGELGTERRAA